MTEVHTSENRIFFVERDQLPTWYVPHDGWNDQTIIARPWIR